jgi:hypothetical protein
MEETLQFLVMVDSRLDDSGLLALVMEQFPDAVRRKRHSCDVHGNWLEIWENESADAALIGGEDGFLHYAWRVEVTPLTDDLDEDHQVKLARDLRTCFERAGARAVVCANFEDRV